MTMDKLEIMLPQICFFCGELITKRGHKGDCLIVHSLDGNHDNWESSNKVPTHRKCHNTIHLKGSHRTEETKRKMSDYTRRMWFNLSPEERAELMRKMSEGQKGKGYVPSLEHRRKNSDVVKRSWARLTPEEKKERVGTLQQKRREWWESLTLEEKTEYGRKVSEGFRK